MLHRPTRMIQVVRSFEEAFELPGLAVGQSALERSDPGERQNER